MSIQETGNRALFYVKRNGIRAAIGRAWLGAKRFVSGGGQVLYSCDLTSLQLPLNEPLGGAQLQRKRTLGELNAKERAELINALNSPEAERLVNERFGRGASVWLVLWDGKLVGYGWSMIGGTIEPHFLDVGPNDVHLFDFFVLPEFRGRGINPWLTRRVLSELASERRGKSFIEAAEWNQPQLASLAKTPFVIVGRTARNRPMAKPR